MSYKEVYGAKWPAHKLTCEQLVKVIEAMKGSPVCGLGFGATDAAMIEGDSDDANEPDIFVNVDREIVCAIEVTGSDKAKVPPGDIYIRKGKFDHAWSSKFPVWFYVVYPRSRSTFALLPDDIYPYRENLTKVKADVDPYIQVPVSAARASGDMIEWIKGTVQSRSPEPESDPSASLTSFWGPR